MGLLYSWYFSISFTSTSRQQCEGLALQFPFLHHFKDTVPPSEACLCGALTVLWFRLSNNLPLACPSL